MVPGGTLNLKLEKLCGFTGKSPSVIVSVCDIVMNSRSCCAAELLLITTHAIAGSINIVSHTAGLGLERRRPGAGIGTSAGAAGAELFPATTSAAPPPAGLCPHLRQNCDSSDSSAPQLLQSGVAAELIPTTNSIACPHFRQNSEPSGRFVPHLLQNTAASLDSSLVMLAKRPRANSLLSHSRATLVGEARF